MLHEIGRDYLIGDPRLLSEQVAALKHNITDEAIYQWPENPYAGLDMGQAYKVLTYNLVNAWYEEHIPDDLKPDIGVAAFGSTARGELCFYSDVDLALYHNGGIKKRTAETYKKELSEFLESAGMRPEVKVWGLRPRQMKLMEVDLVQAETVLFSERIAGESADLETLREHARHNPRAKALYTIFELKKPRFMRKEEDVFNLKWEGEGGLINYLALRSIAATYGAEGARTEDMLAHLREQKIISDEEQQFLTSTLSAYMMYRNQMHIFAGDVAERLGSRTRRFISQHIPSVGSPDRLKNHIETLRLRVHKITQRVIHNFLQDMGIDPQVYANFDDLPVATQLTYARASDNFLVEMAAWSSKEPEVLAACLETNQNWSTLHAIARSETAAPATFELAERQTRYRSELDFARMQLIVNPSLSIQTLINLHHYTNNDRAKGLVKKRLAHIQYEAYETIPPESQHAVDAIVFYPIQGLPKNLILQPDVFLRPTPKKLYLNFAGRLAQGKNVTAYLQILKQLYQEGVDFEAHVFGITEPSIASEVQMFWDTLQDFSIVDKIKYHGRYTHEELGKAVRQMQQIGSPLFLLPKGLVSKELLSLGVPILSTHQGNYDLEQIGMCTLDEKALSDRTVTVDTIKRGIENLPVLYAQTHQVHALLKDSYSLEHQGKQFVDAIEGVAPLSSDVLFLGTSPLESPHGPAAWSRNLISHLRTTGWNGEYFYPNDITQPLQQRSDMPLIRNYRNGSEGSVEDFQVFVDMALATHKNDDETPEIIERASEALMSFATAPQALDFLITQEAQTVFLEAVAQRGFDPSEVDYPSTVLDVVNIYNTPINPSLKLARWVYLLQKQLPPSGIIVTHGTMHPLLAIREKRQKGIPFIHVDHVLATEEPLLRGILDNDFYTDTEKKWLIGLNTLLRKMTLGQMDRYIALWPVNERVATTQLGIPRDKVLYIPNGVAFNF